MKKFIGLDVGDVRIGVAKCDPLGILATALEVIDRNVTDPIERIKEILSIGSVTFLSITSRAVARIPRGSHFATPILTSPTSSPINFFIINILSFSSNDINKLR